MAHPQPANAVRSFAAALNGGDPDAATRHLAADYFEHQPTGDQPTAAEVFSEMLADLRAGLPDLRLTLDAIADAGEGQITGSLALEGTHTGTLWGVPPTGEAVRWESAFTARAVGDRFAVRFDGVGMPELMGVLRQLELVPPPDQMDRPPKHPRSYIPDPILRVAFTGGMRPVPCDHFEQARILDSDVRECPQCVASGDVWPSLRLCMTCGFVGCCDTSKNTHMKRHSEETGHVLIRALRNDEAWVWCYEHGALFDGRELAALQARRSEA